MGNVPDKRGRTPLLVRFDQIRETVLDALINEGATVDMAARKAGVARKTIFNWLRKGREARAARDSGEGPLTAYDDAYIEFADKVDRAEYEIIKKHLDRIDEAGEENWTASAWMLERRFPEQFSLKRTIRHEGSEGGPVEFTVNIGDEPDEDAGGKPPEAIEADYEVVDEEEEEE